MNTKINDFFRLGTNEFLRFNDLRPVTSRLVFLYTVLALAFGYAGLQAIHWWADLLFPESFFWSTLILQSIFLFFLIPVASLILRRISDTKLLQPAFESWFRLKAGNGMSQATFWAVSTICIAILGFSLYWAPIAILLLLFGLGLLPAETQTTPLKKSPSYFPASSISSPPRLGSMQTGFNETLQVLPKAQEFVKTVNPSKPLPRRIGFWLAVLIALFPFVLSFSEQISGLVDRPVVPSTSTLESISPTVLTSESAPVSTSPSNSPMSQSSSASFTVDSKDTLTDDGSGDVLVVPLDPNDAGSGLDPRFRYCTHAIAAGFGPYVAGIDPEYAWYNDRDGDGIVCER